MSEIIFKVTEDEEDGGFVASALGHSIFTEAHPWEGWCLTRCWLVKGFCKATGSVGGRGAASGNGARRPTTEQHRREHHPWEELRTNVREALLCHFYDGNAPTVSRLHRVMDELIAVA